MSISAQRILLALACGASLGAQAQVYRIVGPDGKVTFSDRPPPEAAARATPAPAVAMPSAGGGALPFELRNVSSRYPVTLYTGADCAPCNSARIFLASRGIPFSEKTVSSNEDAAALRQLSGEVRVPFLTIGSQQLRGYSETEWTQYLDAAGYPKTSRLPAGYRNPPPTPLVASQPAAAPRPAEAAAVEQPQQPTVSLPPPPPPENPGTIRF